MKEWYTCGSSRGMSTACAPVCRKALRSILQRFTRIFLPAGDEITAGADLDRLPGYFQFWNSAEKRAIPARPSSQKHAPLSVTYGVGVDDLDHEGRMITLEYEKFYLVTCYTPNAQDALKRIDHRLSWDDAFRSSSGNLMRASPSSPAAI